MILTLQTTLTYDVDGSKKLCFRFWGTHNSPKAESFNNKDNFEKCKTAGVEVCAWNVLPMLLMDILL